MRHAVSCACAQYNQHFLKKIPAGAEAANILVGDADLLTSPLYAFIRLQKATLFGDITEVPVPTRFVGAVDTHTRLTGLVTVFERVYHLGL